jgi:hypothetical protein
MGRKYIAGIFIFILGYFLIQSVAEFYVDLQWFAGYNQVDTFWTLFYGKFYVAVIFFFIFVALFALNFLLIRLIGGSGRIFTKNILDRLQVPFFGTPRRALFVLLSGGVVVAGVFMGMGASAFWKEFLMYVNAGPFTGFPVDPVFGHDIGFYVFSLPFYRFLYHWLMISLVMITLFSAFFHLINGGISVQAGGVELSLFSRAHLSTLAALIVLLYGIGYRISAYAILYSERAKFFGAGYTDVNARLFAFNVCMALSFIAAALLFFNIVKRSFKFPVIVLLSLIPAYFVLGTVFPAIQQRYMVEPNELDLERPFISNNIHFTRIAYDIDRVQEKVFPNKTTLTYRDIANNRDTLESIRLWDWRPLKSTYKQLQEQKQYYYFNDVDVDRYMIDGRKIAVNLSARELSIRNMGRSSQSWINQHLIYTHGYGLVMSRVDRMTPEGMPEFLIHDIPPKSKIDIKIDNPAIYYGEHENPYVIVNTTITPGEFDYPSGSDNIYAKYAGKGGVALDSFMKRLMFTVALNNINILITGSITRESRVLYRRNIVEMARTMAPFLELDDDPYLVVSGGRLYWIIDAYTVTDNFPYSTPVRTQDSRRINYIRNSVKVVIDAYEGSMNFYTVDPNDPIIATYSRIFPGLFRKIDDAPAELRDHFRYPEDLFNIQCAVLLRYHMKNVDVFYGNEDAWSFPKQVFEDREDMVHSYYLVTKLPKEERSEFILTIPFTPLGREDKNMVAFMTAHCDHPNYGRLTLFMLPKDRQHYGPMQVESRITSDPEISKQLALWVQGDTSLIRGNMLVIPIEESLLMIEPLYIKAKTSEIPELRRVFVAFNEQIVMEADIDSAIERIFSGKRGPGAGGARDIAGQQTIESFAGRAYNHFLQAEKYQREGNWAKYGEEIQSLKNVLSTMKGMRAK